MQSFAHLPGLASTVKNSENHIVQAFSSLLSLLSQSDVAFLEPNIFRNMINEELPQFRNQQQQDTHEFLRELLSLILDKLEPEENSLMRKKIKGKVQRSKHCRLCERVTSQPDRFSDLSLSFPEIEIPVMLKSMLDLYFSPEDLETKIECEFCEMRTEATEFYKIVPPQLLTIHQKRFIFENKAKNRKRSPIMLLSHSVD